MRLHSRKESMCPMNHEKSSRNLISAGGIIFLLLVVAGCLLFVFWPRAHSSSAVARIYYDGREVYSILLDTAEDTTFRLEENPKAGFQIQEKKIRFIDTECPDKLCENVGFISKPGETAICLPNRVTLKITGGTSSGMDGVVQ